MNFDPTDWKILAFKVGRKRFFEHYLTIANDFDCHL